MEDCPSKVRFLFRQMFTNTMNTCSASIEMTVCEGVRFLFRCMIVYTINNCSTFIEMSGNCYVRFLFPQILIHTTYFFNRSERRERRGSLPVRPGRKFLFRRMIAEHNLKLCGFNQNDIPQRSCSS